MTRKRTRISGRMLFTWFVLAGLILFFAPQALTNKFQFAFAHIFRWPLSISRSISLAARAPSLRDIATRKEYEKLRTAHNQLQNHLANVIEQRAREHRKVEELSGLRNRLPLEGAKLVQGGISMAPDGSKSELIIDCGQVDGLVKGQFVIDDNSIIGAISDVSLYTAKVRLFTDLASKIAVKIARSNNGNMTYIANGVMYGDGKNSAKIPLLSKKLKIKTGDIVFVREKSGLLDAPIIAGKVAECSTDSKQPLLWDITVKPVSDMERLNNVTVIVMNPK